MKRCLLLLVSALVLAACTALPRPTAATTPAPAPAVSPAATAAAGTPAPSPGEPTAGPVSPAVSPAPEQTPVPSPQASPSAPAVAGSVDELAALLPGKAGHQWLYSGFAEYSATLTLQSIERTDDARVYTAKGEIGDMSGGESPGDFSLQAVYTVTPGVLRQKLAGSMAMDRAIPELELIRAPLAAGAKWTQTVPDSTGNTVTLACEITDIGQVNGRKVYRVHYKAEGSDYYEKREITEGLGITAFDKLYMYDAGREEIGYRLYTPETRVDITGWDQWLPRLDYEYTYFGLAEYGHKGSLSRVSAQDTEFIYDFNGYYDDASGDSSRFTVRYYVDLTRGTVTEQVVTNERGEPEVNSKLHNLVVLQFPLGMRARWSHEAKLDGQSVTVRAEVIEYDEERGVVKVKYTAKEAQDYYSNTYVEIRTFEKGLGMTGFACLLPGSIGITDEEAQYAEKLQDALNQHMFGYSVNKTLIQ